MTQRYAKKRDAILHAAAQLFNQHGMKGATLSDVAGRVDLSTNSITYYYKKKEDLVVACLLRSIEVINDIISSAAEAPSPAERIRVFIRLFVARLARIQTGDAPEMMAFRDVQTLASPHSEVVYAAYTDMFRRVRRLLASDAVPRADRVALNARSHLLLTLTIGAMSWSSRYDPEDHELVAERMSDVLIGGLAAPASRWGSTALDEELAHAPEGADTTQDAFLRAATALINEAGYRGASVDRISARLNVTKGSFYHHNPSKEELISACFERTFAVTRRMQMIALKASGPGWDKLCAVARALVRFQFSEHGPLLRMSAWSELPDEIREDNLRTINQLGQRFVSFLVDGMKDGSIRPLDQMIAAYQVGGMINASVVLDRWVPDITAENAVELFVRPLFLGILAE
ncbi:MAG TPA: TetR/AcrR family transcriptional regulator [Noviherbaspirillum sp.]|uniref:TetR/AcrR family transcriptional regulator n=1 Tax=Noviherbaspirillum sp. TaxID=1926288 RepID=UPI002B497A0E|nr:TetR/AcrR family transcriptional regulator [Noviherbaspirillum sp.]HJV85189.1 TetR/AcrR family transcriptional regulator [Noviherbaspirillum sp.]